MTKLEALDQLKETRTLTVEILEPLDITDGFFSHFEKMNASRQNKQIKRIIKREERKVQAAMEDIAKKIKLKYGRRGKR